MKKMIKAIPVVLGLALLTAIAVKEYWPDIGQKDESLSELALKYDQLAVGYAELEAAKRAYTVSVGFTDSWSMAEFQSDDIEVFVYDEDIDVRMLRISRGQVVRKIQIVGKPEYRGMVTLGTKMWVDIKTHIKAEGHPELYLRGRIEQNEKYSKVLVRFSDVVPPVYGLAPWTDGIPRDRLEDGGKRRIVARLVCLLKPGQTTEELIFPLPLGKCGWRVNSDETIMVNVNDMKFTATDGEDIDSSSARRDDRIIMLEVTLGRDVKRPQVPVEFVCYEYI